MTYRLMSILVIASMALTGEALAREGGRDGFIEIVAGPTIPQGDDDYEDIVDDTFKLGLRGGAMGQQVGFEIGFDYADLDPTDVLIANFEASRFRFLVGGRGGSRFGKVLVFGRAAIGVDYLDGSVEVFGVEEDRSDLGLALEIGGGATFQLGNFYLGGQLAIPMGFHFEEDDDDKDDDMNLDYTSVEIDLLLTAGLVF